MFQSKKKPFLLKTNPFPFLVLSCSFNITFTAIPLLRTSQKEVLEFNHHKENPFLNFPSNIQILYYSIRQSIFHFIFHLQLNFVAIDSMATGGNGHIETGTVPFRFWETGKPMEKGEPRGERSEVKFVKFNEGDFFQLTLEKNKRIRKIFNNFFFLLS